MNSCNLPQTHRTSLQLRLPPPPRRGVLRGVNILKCACYMKRRTWSIWKQLIFVHSTDRNSLILILGLTRRIESSLTTIKHVLVPSSQQTIEASTEDRIITFPSLPDKGSVCHWQWVTAIAASRTSRPLEKHQIRRPTTSTVLMRAIFHPHSFFIPKAGNKRSEKRKGIEKRKRNCNVATAVITEKFAFLTSRKSLWRIQVVHTFQSTSHSQTVMPTLTVEVLVSTNLRAGSMSYQQPVLRLTWLAPGNNRHLDGGTWWHLVALVSKANPSEERPPFTRFDAKLKYQNVATLTVGADDWVKPWWEIHNSGRTLQVITSFLPISMQGRWSPMLRQKTLCLWNRHEYSDSLHGSTSHMDSMKPALTCPLRLWEQVPTKCQMLGISWAKNPLQILTWPPLANKNPTPTRVA